MPEVTYTNWFERMGKSFGGVIVGLILFLGSFVLLWWNEGRAVHRARDLAEGTAACIAVDPAKVDSANEGKLVYLSGEATTSDSPTDTEFKVVAPKALKLTRNVEIYQWVERSESKKKKNVVGGGETTTTYYYHEKKWVDKPISSANFKPDDGEGDMKGKVPTNVGDLPYQSQSFYANPVTVGAYKLTPSQVDRIGTGTRLALSPDAVNALPTEQKEKLQVRDGNLYRPYGDRASPGSSPNDDKSSSSVPQIGDVRITYTEIKPQAISLISGQVKDGFQPWKTSGGGSIDELRTGSLSKEQMFDQAVAENNALTWILRLVGLVLMAVGIFLCLNPLSVFVSFLPFVGDLLGVGIAIFAVAIALPLSLITIALAWVSYRPLVGIPLLVAAVALIVGIFWLGRRRRPAAPVGG